MDADAFLETVRGENKTALSRLGSSKSLYADTEGEMDAEPVLRATADHYGAAADVLAEWAEDDGAFADLAAAVADQYETVVSELGDHDPERRPAVEALAASEHRAGALAGWAVVTDTKTAQLVGFFVGQADPQSAQTFREVGDAMDDVVANAAALAVDGADDPDAAVEAAGAVIQAAYDAYTETLEGMGVNPKPVC
jgi:hypothetical protein